jgi:PAS domain S-box-containing protein
VGAGVEQTEELPLASPTGLDESDRFRAIFDSALELIGLLTPDGTLLEANRSSLDFLGISRDEVVGRPFWETPWWQDSPHEQHRLREAIAAAARGRTVQFETRHRNQRGAERVIHFSLRPVFDRDGRVQYLVPEGRDVTDQWSLERHKDQFLANISHDLRTPLAGIKASIGVVLANEPAETPTPLHRMFVNIDQAADRMIKLVTDLLDLTYVQAGRLRIQRELCDLRRLVDGAARAIEPLARKRGQRLELRLPAEPASAYVDESRLQRALTNLLSNAQRYGRDGGRIQVALEADDRYVRIAVSDDGPGIAPAERERIFERFYRPEAEQVNRNEGSGLGLPIARAMVELHGGRIWAESEPGAGSIFWIEIPNALSAEAAEVAAEMADGPAESGAGSVETGVVR